MLEVLERARHPTSPDERGALFDRALRAVDDLEDEDERERLLILVMEALGLARE